MTEARIPVCEPALDGNELTYITDAVRSGWISSGGDYLRRFEEGFARYVGVGQGIGTTSGTTALHLALAALGVGSGHEVIIPDFTMIASAFAVCYCGAMPVFVDADPETWNMDVAQLAAKIGPRTKAIMAVHIYGHPTDMDPLLALARTKRIAVLEDAAEAHGALYKGRRCGSLADLAAFSFYANKAITTGEGGMVVTNDAALADECRSLRNLSFPRTGGRVYLHDRIGFNYRMSNLQGALGLAQLERIDTYVAARRAHAARYAERLAAVRALQLPAERPWATSSYWMYAVVLRDEAPIGRDELAARLAADGIETRPFFQPMHVQPALLRYGASGAGAYPVADRLAARGLYLPSGSDLTDAQIDRVCGAVARHLA
ncbi:MAG TPA: DegT/DnrJ/EryC1/StrS family aminotransferase [Candidatus Limnocylindria bacterium]|nr:DegT/DnrJ/EryC1/StrS family aminotransferase [Candidatus Limnocylindria bacterium]